MKEHKLMGVTGTLHTIPNEPKAGEIVTMQVWTSEVRSIPSVEEGAVMRVEVRYDDQCKNGHNSFSVTATVWDSKRGEPNQKSDRGFIMGGCCHDEVATAFPELAHLIKWHQRTSYGPLFYEGNTVYLAGERDHWGKLKGEPRSYEARIVFDAFPFPELVGKLPGKFIEYLQTADAKQGERYAFTILEVQHPDHGKPGKYQFKPKYTVGGYGVEWYRCPFDTLEEAEQWTKALENEPFKFVSVPTAWGEGKARELDKARRAAIWPEATDEELMVPEDELRAKLAARLPALKAAFRADLDACGLVGA